MSAELRVEGLDVLIVSILVLFLGSWLTDRFAFLSRMSIPPAVSGGIVCSLLVALIYVFGDRQISFDSGGSPSVSGTAAPSCGDCGDGVTDFGEECDTGGATGAHANCGGDCDMVTDFLGGQTACECN